MEAGDIGSRQSGTTTANAPDRYEQQQRHHHQHYPPQPQQPRETLDRLYRDAPPPAMATATLISPSTPYPGHPHSFTSGYPHVTTGPPTGGMISPVEPRRPSDDADAPPQQRQSLPSISEVISSARSEYPQPGPGPPTSLPPAGPSGPAPTSATSSFPSSFSATARPYPEPPIEKGPSPRPMQPSSSYPPGQQPLPAFADSPRARQFGGGRPGPPPIVGPYSAPHPSPPIKQDPMRPESDKPPEPHHVNGGYPSHPPPTPMSYPPSHGQLPPSQLPLSAGYPVSPRHAGPPLPSPYESQRTPRPEDEAQHARRYDMAVHRNLESWSYTDCLNRIATGARTIFNFADGYHKIVGEHTTPRMIPERLPTEREMTEMLSNVEYMKQSLEQLRDQVQQNLRHEQMQGKMKGPYEDEDVQMYDTAKPTFGVTEVKKRRGRAAPPGRCHSCNRIDTPEWRRGPDGARTLCNACGLHYAKLERKRLLEARSIRPKGSDEQN